MLTPENEEYYDEVKNNLDNLMVDYHEYLQIISEFRYNKTLQKIHNHVIDEIFNNKPVGEEIPIVESLYVLTIRKLIEMILANVNLDEYIKDNKGDGNE